MTEKVHNITRNMVTATANQKDPKDPMEAAKMIAPKGLEEELDEFAKVMPLTDETTCGFGCFKGAFLQRFANKKMFVLLYGLAGCCYSSTYSYFNASITTLEKRFKIPSRTTGVISIGNDITALLLSVILSYYAGRGHRPRWIAFGLYCVALFCFMTALPHFIYGPGEDSLMLTHEYSRAEGSVVNSTVPNVDRSHNHKLCDSEDNSTCNIGEVNLIPQIILFSAQLISGMGGTLYYTIGFSYMDDNIKKSKSPALISLSYFIRTLGPAIGYALASACLKLYVDPTATPTIQNSDPRWLGAWWLGWLILGVLIVFFASALSTLPKTLPRAAARREFNKQKSKDSSNEEVEKPSIKDMIVTIKRLLKNKTYVYNNLASIFYVFGYIPYWLYMPKYIETLYRQSASISSLVTGTVGLVFSALGILISGLLVQHYKPRARYMAAWNVIVAIISLIGITGYSMLGCEDIEKQIPLYANGQIHTDLPCNADCNCDYVKYSPVCALDSSQTYISPCHAGCTQEFQTQIGTKVYSNCSCVEPNVNITARLSQFLHNQTWSDSLSGDEGLAVSGPCPVDCHRPFYIFLALVCLLKLAGATGRVTNFLVSVRCVEEKDKSISLGIDLSALSFFALIPSPIIFGYIMDSTCLVWGKTCSGTGNCWLYNAETLRTRISYVSATFVAIGAIFDMLVWASVKNLKIFDDEACDTESSHEREKKLENLKVDEIDKDKADIGELEKLNDAEKCEQKLDV